MHVILIAVPILDYRHGQLAPIAQDETKNCPPYGIYLLTSVLRARGHEVTLVDLIAEGRREIDTFKHLLPSAGLVGIGATSMSWPTAVDVISQIRDVCQVVPIVLGGIHPTMFDHYLLTHFDVDYVVRGEGEESLPALCEALERSDGLDRVPNLSWKDNAGKVIRNPSGPKIKADNLADFPMPAYDELPDQVYKGVAIESSRGCAFDCSFCSTSYRKSWRGIPPESFVNRLERVAEYIPRTTYKSLHIIDDEFSMNPQRAIDIARTLRKRGLKPGLVYDSRANDLLFPGYVEEIAEFTHQFLVGAECGYDEGLKLVGKGTTCGKLEGAAAMLERFGISNRADFSFILGLPWEGRAEVQRTIDFAMHLTGEYGVRILLQWYCQIPGSRLWEDARQRFEVTEAMYDDYGFFRDLHLWHTAITISPSDAWDIVDMIQQLQCISHLTHAGRAMIESAVPAALARYFPQAILPTNGVHADGLMNLREVSRPAADRTIKIGVPQRHTFAKE